MLTDWCNAACACCYANCSPAGDHWMNRENVLRIWEQLIQTSPHGCRVHLTGGEVFGRYEHLLAVCTEAYDLGLGPLEAIETNGYWATDKKLIRDRLAALNAAGMGRLTISADPYHQQFVPIDRPRRLAEVAVELLGADRVRIRWQDWLSDGVDTSTITPHQREKIFARYAGDGRDRLTGRGARGIPTCEQAMKPLSAFTDKPCNEQLLRGKHVHIAPTGEVWPATCVGIVAGNALEQDIQAIWANLHREPGKSPIIGPLSEGGPAELARHFSGQELTGLPTAHSSKCQLCYNVRKCLQQQEQYSQYLGPPAVYAQTDEPA